MSISLSVCADLPPTSSLIPSLTVLSWYSPRLCCRTHTHTRLPELKKALAFCYVYSGHISTILLQFWPSVFLATFPSSLSPFSQSLFSIAVSISSFHSPSSFCLLVQTRSSTLIYVFLRYPDSQ